MERSVAAAFFLAIICLLKNVAYVKTQFDRQRMWYLLNGLVIGQVVYTVYTRYTCLFSMLYFGMHVRLPYSVRVHILGLRSHTSKKARTQRVIFRHDNTTFIQLLDN